MSLRLRFSLIILGLMLLVQVFFGGAYYYLERKAELSAMYQEVHYTVRLAASVCREAALTDDWSIPVDHFVRLKRDPAVIYADCIDRKGRALVHSDPARIGRTQDHAAPRDEEAAWVVSHSIRIRGSKYGVARIGYDAEVLHDQIRYRLIRTLWLMARVSAVTLLFGLMAAFLVARTLTRPIEAIVDATHAISSGNLRYRLKVSGRRDELGTLGRRFNQMAKKLGELDKMKEQVVRSLAHDLKNPLASIKGCAEEMLTEDAGPLTPKQKKYMESSLDCSLRLWGYIDNILDTMKLQSGQYPIKIRPIEVAVVVDSVLEDQQPKAKGCGVRLKSEVPEGLPRVKADYELIHRVLDNLVSNALKFTPPKGEITVRAVLDHSFVRFEVEDTGAGIPDKNIDKVFKDFFQVDETRAQSRERGKGMGLAICQRIVTEHRGRIWVESKLGTGAAFFFTLPVA